jgi:hypothetical protein
LNILTETLLRIPFSVIDGTFIISLQSKYSFWDTILFRKKYEEMSGEKKRLENQASSRCDEWDRKIRLTSALRRIGNQTITADVGKRMGKAGDQNPHRALTFTSS